MSFGKTNPRIAIIVNGRDDRLSTKGARSKTKTSTTSSTTSTETTCASTVTSSIATTPSKAKSTSPSVTNAARPSVAEIKAASKRDELDDELESMLSLTQTLSFWDGDGDEDGDTFADSYDNTSYSGNTYDTSSTFDGRRGLGDRFNNQVESCGEGLEGTLETLVFTGRAISSALMSGSKSMNSLFLGKLTQQVEKKEKMKKREEEKRMKREAQLREEMMTARYEISNVVNLWREK